MKEQCQVFRRSLCVARTKTDFDSGKNEAIAKFEGIQVFKALFDIKAWLDGVIVGAFGIGVAAFGLFMPTFIHAFGFSPRSYLPCGTLCSLLISL